MLNYQIDHLFFIYLFNIIILLLMYLTFPMHPGVNCFFGALATSMPSTTFAQNNGVINVTRVASRSAGVACGIWLILFGIIAKVRAIVVQRHLHFLMCGEVDGKHL